MRNDQAMARCAVLISVLALAACGGAASSPPLPDPPIADAPPAPPAPPPVPAPPAPPLAVPGSAAECFNPQLFAVGTTYALYHQISGTFGGSRTRFGKVEASSSAPEDRLVSINTTNNFSPPVPGGTDVKGTQEVQTVDGLDIVTKQVFETHTVVGQNFLTVYQPPLRDKRYSLLPGGEFQLVRSIGFTDGFSTGFTTTVRYAGQESVTVPAGTYATCKFEERIASGDVITTWIVQGKGILAKSVRPDQTEELLGTSRLNGQPI